MVKKAKIEDRIILDFSLKCSKKYIEEQLKKCYLHNYQEVVIHKNIIQVGIYSIVLVIPYDSNDGMLSQLDFQVSIYEDGKWINLYKDDKFNTQDWVSYNYFGKLKIKQLVNIISYCRRLDRWKVFF